VSDGQERGPRPPAWLRAILRSAFGAPSAGLSLVGLRPRRARLCFTRRQHGNESAVEEQVQARVVVEIDPSRWRTPEPWWVHFARRCGSRLRADYERIDRTCATRGSVAYLRHLEERYEVAARDAPSQACMLTFLLPHPPNPSGRLHSVPDSSLDARSMQTCMQPTSPICAECPAIEN
jgi:hypothetical protein